MNTGKGPDRKGTGRERERTACVCDGDGLCSASCQGTWRYEAIDWHDSYEARVELNGETLGEREKFKTRLDAQLAAESRKVFESFSRCGDQRAWEAACEDQPNDSFLEVCVSEPFEHDAEMEYLRQWLLKNGATEDDEYVFVGICW